MFDHEDRGRKAGVYIHIPFCERLCPYCDFAVSIEVDIPHREYTEAVVDELRDRADEIDDRSVATIYFGGGTPSLLAGECLEQLLAEVDALLEVDGDVEVTMEANPNQVTPQNLATWDEIGIERLSIGCQSFQDRHLQALKRNHDGRRARQAARRALEVMERVSIDLMFAGPSQPIEEWEEDLEVMHQLVCEHGLDHVSGYNLTIEEGTTFWIRRKQGMIETPDHDTAASMLERLVEATASVGLRRYEVSNFAVPGGESRHNSSYWQGRPYLGVGVGAHSLEVRDDGSARRRQNPDRYDAYLEADGAAANVENLEPVDHLAERLFLGARTRFGIDFGDIRRRFFPSLGQRHLEEVRKVLGDLVERDWLETGEDSEVYRPTERGLNFSDALAEWLFEAATDAGGG